MSEVPPGPTSGWYSASGIEARLKVRRLRPADAIGARTRARPAEEDAYAEAGAPGYDSPCSGAAEISASSASSEPHESVHESQIRTTEPASSAPQPHTSQLPLATGSSPSYDLFSRRALDWPVVRTSSAAVSASSLPAFLRAFQLSVQPFYAAAAGCRSVALWVGEVPADAAPADVCASALVGRARAGMPSLAARRAAQRGGHDNVGGVGGASAVPVTAVTTWTCAAALEEATSSSAYAEAMSSLAIFFIAPPSTRVVREVAYVSAHDFKSESAK